MHTLVRGDERGLADPQQARSILHRERMRADRTGQMVSVVVFEVGNQTSRCVARLADALVEGSRATDEIGWFDKKRPCAILPATPAGGAECFADRMSELARGVPSVRYTIHVYPQSPRGGGEDGGCGEGTDWPKFGRSRHLKRAIGTAIVTSETDSAVATLDEPEGDYGQLRPHQRAMPVDPLLCEPLPAWKRSMDTIGAIIGLVIFLPVMILIAILIKLTSRGPVLFRQRRAGLGNRPFTIYKFRTMVLDADAHKAELRPFSEQDGPAFKMSNDPRMTWVGRILRKTSLDELPQFWNVLIGNMSLVGPRPLPLDEAAECEPWQQQRLLVTPGLTCIWQVRGRSAVPFEEWMRMDMRYIRRRSIAYDVWLILRTFWAVVLRRGAH